MYQKIGLKQVKKFNELYNVKVTKYVCNESIEVLNLKPNQFSELDESEEKEKQPYLLNDEEL